ncbi:hypothetical protein GGR88_002488 [Sphingomonas jejuensis]|uniref:DUF4440 domain-containing protein n=1 Tax=Sphingomonas jejuensis TaxID=904715 RepID=A0ABX0XQA5_9SPHN|nr:DUF4440 domain-containing protein [Sphingomonas jejuensis]NJC34974.1 hypothetical protein [Sphingomonas jejuensis]
MDDDRVWDFETKLWKADEAFYRDNLDDKVIMVMPSPFGVMDGEQVIKGVSDTPRWSTVEFSEQRISRIQYGLLVAGYRVHADKEDAPTYEAWCTTTYRLDDQDKWWVVQHQQTPIHHQAD